MKPADLEKTVKVAGRQLTLTRLNKVFYPKTGFTKAGVLDYYLRIAPWMLPHLRRRMLTLKRYPEGAGGLFFYEKRCPSYKPAWLKTKLVKSTHGREDIPYCEIDSAAALLWAANLAALELHVLLSTTQNIHRPTSVVFDLDPGPGRSLGDCGRLALRMRVFLKALKLECFLKTSGKKGLHLYVPLNTPVTFERTKAFARKTVEALEQKYPGEITSNMKKTERAGRIFIDWSQNDFHKTTVCVYSLRAAEIPSVSTPLAWDEAETLMRSRRESAFTFASDQVLKRTAQRGDLFAPVLTLKQKLPY